MDCLNIIIDQELKKEMNANRFQTFRGTCSTIQESNIPLFVMLLSFYSFIKSCL